MMRRRRRRGMIYGEMSLNGATKPMAWIEAAFEQAFDCIAVLRADGIVVEVNRAALECFGTTHEQAVGRALWELAWPSDASVERQRLAEAVRNAAGGASVRYELELSGGGGEGSRRIFDFSLKPVRDDRGDINLVLAEARDITERKRQEQTLQAAHDEKDTSVRARTEELAEANKLLRQEIGHRRRAEEANA
jgi:PAS domain S-box-containing protein